MERKFTIVDEITRQYRRFNTVGTQLKYVFCLHQRGTNETPFSISEPVWLICVSMLYEMRRFMYGWNIDP